jgi:hypothetical protein
LRAVGLLLRLLWQARPRRRKAQKNRLSAACRCGTGVRTSTIRELRDLLDAWRDARRTAWQTTVKVLTTGVLAALLVSVAIKLRLMGGTQ